MRTSVAGKEHVSIENLLLAAAAAARPNDTTFLLPTKSDSYLPRSPRQLSAESEASTLNRERVKPIKSGRSCTSRNGKQLER